jgi:hypothetical protein
MLYTNAHITLNIHPLREEEDEEGGEKNVTTSERKQL